MFQPLMPTRRLDQIGRPVLQDRHRGGPAWDVRLPDVAKTALEVSCASGCCFAATRNKCWKGTILDQIAGNVASMDGSSNGAPGDHALHEVERFGTNPGNLRMCGSPRRQRRRGADVPLS